MEFSDVNITDKRKQYWEGIFGDIEKLSGSENDLKYLAERQIKTKERLPRLYAWCGTEDFLYDINKEMWNWISEQGYELTSRESEGDHQWKYWDEQIRNVLKWWLK